MCGGSSPLTVVVDPIEDLGGTIGDLGNQVDQQVVQPISNEASNAAQTVGDVGNQIDQSVNDTIPGGWALPAAIAVAATTGYLDPTLLSGEMAVAPELDATGSMASQAGTLGVNVAPVASGIATPGITSLPTASATPNVIGYTASGHPIFGSAISTIGIDPITGAQLGSSTLASGGSGLGLGTGTLGTAEATDAGLSMIPPDTFVPDVSPPAPVENLAPELDATGSMSQQALQAPVIDMSPTTPVANVSPELDSTGSLATPTYDFSPNTPVQNVSPELDPTGSMATGTSASDIANALRAANSANNLIKSLTSSQQQLAKNQQNLQQSQALGNLLKANQFTPIATPEVYKAQNPFIFGQQEPIQGNPLASLLRNNYGNS